MPRETITVDGVQYRRVSAAVSSQIASRTIVVTVAIDVTFPTPGLDISDATRRIVGDIRRGLTESHPDSQTDVTGVRFVDIAGSSLNLASYTYERSAQ